MKTHPIATCILFMALSCAALAGDPFATADQDTAALVQRDQKVQVDIPPRFSAFGGISIQFERQAGQVATYRLINNSPIPAIFGCHGINRPLVRVEVLTQGEWVTPGDRMDCATGLYLTSLAAKKSVTFEVELPKTQSQVRIGIDFFGDENAAGARPRHVEWAAPPKR